MPEDKQQQIIDELKRRVEEMKFGKVIIEFIIHQGKISGAEIIEQRIKLG